MLHVGLLLLLCGIAVWWYLGSRPQEGPSGPAGDTATSANAPTPTAKLTPEQLTERERDHLAKFEGALSDSKNGDGLVETPGYYKLLEVVSNYTPEEITSRITRTFDRDSAMADPDAWRGEFVRARGVISGLTATPLDTRRFGRGMVFRGAIADGDGTGGMIIDLPDHPGQDLGIRSGAYDVEGVFYRVVRYENRAGKQMEAPWLVVRNLRPAPSAHEDRSAFLDRFGPWLLGGIALAIVAWRVLAYVFQRRARRERHKVREPQTIREMFEQRRMQEDRVPPPPSGSA